MLGKAHPSILTGRSPVQYADDYWSGCNTDQRSTLDLLKSAHQMPSRHVCARAEGSSFDAEVAPMNLVVLLILTSTSLQGDPAAACASPVDRVPALIAPLPHGQGGDFSAGRMEAIEVDKGEESTDDGSALPGFIAPNLSHGHSPRLVRPSRFGSTSSSLASSLRSLQLFDVKKHFDPPDHGVGRSDPPKGCPAVARFASAGQERYRARRRRP